MRSARVDRLAMDAPDDVSAIAALFASGEVAPEQVIAILGKTEGNGCVNDFTRGFATQSLRLLLGAHLAPERVDAVSMVMSGGTEGGLSPHWLVLSETQAPESSAEAPAASGPSLAFASVATRPLSPSEIGRPAQAALVRDGVYAAMAKAAIAAEDDVHFVQIKCPLLTSDRIAAVAGDVATQETLKSMGLSRAASALGVAEALGEAPPATQAQIGTDWTLWSSRASASAGVELMCCEIVVMGMSSAWTGPLAIAHAVMRDAIDAPAVQQLLQTIAPEVPPQEASTRVEGVLVKAEASPEGTIRGLRHTMLQDSDLASTRHARALVGGVLAGVIGRTDLFVSGGAEHQGPPGGGPVA
ncbi:MAG: ring-opening amidohydrolase, partial [Pseudomonadota bacterium]